MRSLVRPYFNPVVPRREVLRAGVASLFGLSWPHLLHAQKTHIQGRRQAKACIILFMWGGPAHQDTWDPKPDAPEAYRGEFRSIPTTVPGLHVCEHLPLLARRAHKLCVIRSMTHMDVNHTTATHHLLTGSAAPPGPLSDDRPNYGAVLARLGRGRHPLPPFVSMMPVVPNGAPRFVEESHGQGAGILGPLYQPLRIDADASLPDFRVADLTPGVGLNGELLQQRQQLWHSLDQQRRLLDRQAEAQAMANHYRRAFALLAQPAVARAFDINQEPIRVRERYGMNPHGQSVLLARRLVEAGVPLVTVFWPNDGITNVSVYWDTHSRNFLDLKTRLCPVTDRAFSALLDDLEARGMLDETLVIWTGEMGRTPRVGQAVPGGAGAGADGRDHWAKVFTTVLAGGGVRPGIVYGASDRLAAEPAVNPVTPADLAATVYHLLGVDPHLEIQDRLGRPFTLVPNGRILHHLLL
ncbi:MAG: DUF1501 domain-containing protein [Gemmataceae bacterium]|nr:DUF1501 domain-containing protein [Gemmataceae bacterium]MDW8243163.1 DUF1501 domain-containing protein [Thermogemmata sp.]